MIKGIVPLLVVILALGPEDRSTPSPCRQAVLSTRCRLTGWSALICKRAATMVGRYVTPAPDLFSMVIQFSTGPGPGWASQTDFNSRFGAVLVNRKVTVCPLDLSSVRRNTSNLGS